ncbi:MAG: SpoIID/LytB domain-containing protein [Patescibacteria group bacterium]
MKQRWQEIIISILIAFILVTFISLLLKFLEEKLIKEAEAKTLSYAALRLEQSYPGIINLQANKGFTFWVKFKNIGTKPWLKGKVALKTEDKTRSVFAHPYWPADNTPYIVKWGVPIGAVGTFKFAIQAPEINGLYWQKFQLFNGEEKIPGGEIEIALKVYGGKNPIIQDQETPPTESLQTPISQADHFWEIFPSEYQIKEEIKGPEPKIRVGLFYENSQKPYVYLPIKIESRDQQPYQIRLLNENFLLLTQTKGEETEIDFDFANRRYFINVNGKRVASTDSPIRFLSADPDKEIIFRITSWKRGPFWGEPCNDNEYRGELELKYNPKTDRLWLINELPIEEYMKGVAEVRDSYPIETLKAQKIAARTYAYFRILYPKYTNVPEEDAPLFHLRATQADQVYRGYLWELRSPRIERAAEETKGMVMFYGQDPILAYYFARSDGRTRSSCEVGMTKECLPYLVSVSDPPGLGLTLSGHGVGMPQQGARVAGENGALFHQILRYYYRGIEIKKIW